MASSMKENNQEYMLHVVPMAGAPVATPVDSQYRSTIGSVPINYYGVTYHPTENDKPLTYLPNFMPLSNQSQIFKSHQTLSYTVPTAFTATALNCPPFGQKYIESSATSALPPKPTEATSASFDTEASCSTQCTSSTSKQMSQQSIAPPASVCLEVEKNKPDRKCIPCTCNNCKNKKNSVGPVGKFKHSCDYDDCGRLFLRSSHLKAHIRSSHTGEKPYKCSFLKNSNTICGQTFFRSDLLIRHQRRHTGEKSFICPICTKGFARKDHLNNHIKTHKNSGGKNSSVKTTGEKSFICPICTKGFARKGHLNNHIKTHKNSGGKNSSVKTTDN